MEKEGYLQKGVHYPKGNRKRAGFDQRATNKELWFVAFKGVCPCVFHFDQLHLQKGVLCPKMELWMRRFCCSISMQETGILPGTCRS
jgi:hypothetical protein